MDAGQDFRVDLDVYRGPLDLLLYLVRKHEVEVAEVSLAAIADQYLTYLEALQALEIDEVGDFLEIASLLLEIKSRQALPRQTEEAEEQVEEAQQDLVERLLAYKRFKDAAVILEERGREWQRRLPRQANDAPDREIDLSEQPIGDVELWDLVSAFGRIIREQQDHDPTSVVYDDTPIDVYMRQVHQRLVRYGALAFTEAFEPGMHKSAMIGMFLAVLELSRRYGVLLEQNEEHGEIVLRPSDAFDPTFRKPGEAGEPQTEPDDASKDASSTATAAATSDADDASASPADPWGLGDHENGEEDLDEEERDDDE